MSRRPVFLLACLPLLVVGCASEHEEGPDTSTTPVVSSEGVAGGKESGESTVGGQRKAADGPAAQGPSSAEEKPWWAQPGGTASAEEGGPCEDGAVRDVLD